MQLDLYDLLDINKGSKPTFRNSINKLAREYGIAANKTIFGSHFFSIICRKWSTENIINKGINIRTLSLFSGAGGLDIGFHDLGFNIIETVEIEPAFCETMKNNIGISKYFGKGIKVNNIDIKEYHPNGGCEVDFIIGGPPCQTFSAAGRRANGVDGIQDPRGVLFMEYVRLLKVLQPKGFIFENVAGIIGAQGGQPWEMIKSEFRNAGYNIFYRILDSADYGVPQHRERVFIIGLKDSDIVYRFPTPTHGPDSLDSLPFCNAKDALVGIEYNDMKIIKGKYAFLLEEIPPGLNYSFYTEKLGHPRPVFSWRSKFSDFLYKADPNRPVRTIKANGGQYTGPLHWDSRHFSIDELKRLQSFPDEYKIVGGEGVKRRQIGNSVPPNIARVLAISILEQLFSVKTPFGIHYLSPNAILFFKKRKRELTKYYKTLAKNYHKKNTSNINEYIKELNLNLYIDSSLNVLELKKHEAMYFVSFKYDINKVKIVISPKNRTVSNPFEMEIKARRKWDLPIDSIDVISCVKEPLELTHVWKIIEYVLRKIFYIDDLVQLNGYYQYTSKFRILVKKHCMEHDRLSNAILKIFDGEIVGELIDSKSLSFYWNVDMTSIISIAQELKKLGYDIRNWNTNTQIPLDHYFITYSFPVLNSKSVQTYKDLLEERI